MELPKISIVIPSYNKVDFIDDTLESIFSQKYKNLEVIIQDGGSNDGTLEIIKKYARKYQNKITWESKRDNGQVDAINKGLRKATGDIFTYINADDVYYGQSLEKIGLYFLKNPQTSWVVGQGKVIDENGKEISENISLYKNFLLKMNYYPFLLMVNYLTQPSVFLKKEVYEKYGPFIGTNEYVLEYAMWLKLGKICMPAVLPKVLSSFRISKRNISSISYKKVLADDYKLVKKYTNNQLILFIHKINNIGRELVINFLK